VKLWKWLMDWLDQLGEEQQAIRHANAVKQGGLKLLQRTLEAQGKGQMTALHHLREEVKHMNEKLQEVQDALQGAADAQETLKQAVLDEQQQVNTRLEQLSSQIASLQQQIADGTVTEADLDGLKNTAHELQAKSESIKTLVEGTV
jgi:small-conductance mechanosensitive channel